MLESDNLNKHGFFVFKRCGLDDRANGLGDAALFADHLSHVLRIDAQLDHDGVGSFNLAHVNRIGLIHQRLGDKPDQFDHIQLCPPVCLSFWITAGRSS